MDNLPDSREVKCYLNCLFLELGLRKKSGGLEMGKVLQALKIIKPNEQTRFMNMIKGCIGLHGGKDGCESVYQFNLCMKESSPKDFFVIWRPDLELDP